MIQGIITAVYYLIIAYVVLIMIHNLVRTRSWERELLYVIVLVPFILRLLRLK